MKRKNENQPEADIGFSVNPEMRPIYDRLSEEEKAPLLGLTCQLGGTSSNVAHALANMGIKTKLYALTGYNDDFNTHCFRYALKHSPENIIPIDFNILEQGHMGLIPYDGIKKTSQVFGYKGLIQPAKIPTCLEIIKKRKGKRIWKVATGVRPPEIELVKALFDGNKGFRYLNPRVDLIKEKEIFFDILKETDVLVLNQIEYDSCVNYQELNSMADIQQKFGVSLVIVTKDKDGGKFSLSNKIASVRGKFEAYSDYIKVGEEIFPTGTGDWFGGSFLSVIIKLKKSIYEVTETEINEAINFARKVAGKKITMMGAGNGPRKSDL